MRCAKGFALALAITLVAAGPAGAADPIGTFRVGGVDYKLPLPTGFCLPTGRFADIAQIAAATDPQNVTLLTAYQCANGEITTADYPILIKAPKANLMTQIARSDLLNQLGPSFDDPNFMASMTAKINQDTGKAVSEVVGRDVQTKADVKPLGHDETCGYLGGSIALNSGDLAASANAAVCLTSVSGRLLMIYRYGPTSATTASLAAKAKTVAQTLIASNEKP